MPNSVSNAVALVSGSLARDTYGGNLTLLLQWAIEDGSHPGAGAEKSRGSFEVDDTQKRVKGFKFRV